MHDALTDPDLWAALDRAARRDLLAAELATLLTDRKEVVGTRIDLGPPGRPFDYVAVAETAVGALKTPFWSHARATLFVDTSIHAANRAKLAPARELSEAAVRLRARLAVPFTLESRGLTFSLDIEPQVRRTWVAERARFRDRTAVSREDVVSNAADVDLRDLLAHFYTGPALCMVGEDGEAFLLPAASEEEGRLISLCVACSAWAEGPEERCPACGAATDVVLATRPSRR